MDSLTQQIAELEKIIYKALVPVARATPGLNVSFRDDVILISNENLPDIDTTHACLVQTSPEHIDALIAEIVDYFKMRNLPPTVFTSAACTPTDIGQRLLELGFIRAQVEEAWMILDEIRPNQQLITGLQLKKIDEGQVLTFAEVMLTAWGLSTNLAPLMAQTLLPSMALPQVNHFLGFRNDVPIAACTLIGYDQFGIMREPSILPAYQTNQIRADFETMVIENVRQQGVETLLLQTTAETASEKHFEIHGFKRSFTRAMYTLS
ncbi:MAG: hypothetical protein H6632_02635 [Anaerolineales bacterium]|nr:hypothetical protein [Anaerolineales bacterium]